MLKDYDYRKAEEALTGRTIRLLDAAVLLAREEAANGTLIHRSYREDALANRIVVRVESDYVPGCFGPHLLDENGKNAGQGEWTYSLKMMLREAYLDEKALLIVATPVTKNEDEKLGFMTSRGYVNGSWADYLNNWAHDRVETRGLKSSRLA